jgi:replicative DNA helicase
MDKSTPQFSRIPPQSLDSEKALLGAIMLRPDSLHDILDVVRPESFYSEKHRTIFESIADLSSKREPIDALSLSNKLKEKKQLEQIGGTAYISEILNSVPSAANIDYYAEIIRKKHILRNLINASGMIQEIAFDETHDLDHVLEETERQIYSITNVSKGQKLELLKGMLEEAWERFERLHRDGAELRGVPSGFPEIDSKLSGFQKSDLIILAARPSMGKTSLALDFARYAAKHTIPVAVFSLEMSKQQLVDRMVAAESRVDAWKLRTGKLSLDEDFARLQDAIASLSNAPILIDDQAGNSIMRMRSVVRRHNSKHHDNPIGLIVVDYLQLMTTAKAYDSMVNQVTEISRSLKALAKEFNVPVIALSQLSRAVESRGGRPRLSDLRDSGSIEQDADIVMFIHREIDAEKGGKQNTAEILIEKHRNGPTGKVDLYFDADKSSFISVERSGFGDFSSAGTSGAF